MNKDYTSDHIYSGENFSEDPLGPGEYEACTFTNCVFSESDLSDYVFADCNFDHCDLSMSQLKGTAFREVTFRYCKLMGMHFDDCNDFSISMHFDSCILDFASFFRLKLRNTSFVKCKMESTDFAEADLSNADLSGSDLKDAIFDNTILTGADLRTASNFSIDPEINKITGARFSLLYLAGLLGKYRISVE